MTDLERLSFEIYDETEYITRGNPAPLWSLKILCYTKEEAHQLKDTIQKALEKAERYDRITDYERLNNRNIFATESVYTLEQQLQQTQEKLKKIEEVLENTDDDHNLSKLKLQSILKDCKHG